MNRTKRYLVYAYFISSFLFIVSSCAVNQSKNSHISKNTGNPMDPTRKITRVYPTKRDSNRYLDSNKKKKKKWTKIKQTHGSDCPWYRTYTSSKEKKVKAKLNKKR